VRAALPSVRTLLEISFNVSYFFASLFFSAVTDSVRAALGAHSAWNKFQRILLLCQSAFFSSHRQCACCPALGAHSACIECAYLQLQEQFLEKSEERNLNIASLHPQWGEMPGSCFVSVSPRLCLSVKLVSLVQKSYKRGWPWVKLSDQTSASWPCFNTTDPLKNERVKLVELCNLIWIGTLGLELRPYNGISDAEKVA